MHAATAKSAPPSAGATAPDDLQRACERDGFFILRGLFSAARVQAVEADIAARLRADPPQAHPDRPAYRLGDHWLVQKETEPSPRARNAEEFVAKVFNVHADGESRLLAEEPVTLDVLERLIGPDIDCFQSQMIFKQPGVIGQPWHQDSYYFRFDRQPQIGVWVALTEATLDNGCLWVAPGSHTASIHEHVPDRRPASNAGYKEIVDYDFSNEVPVLLQAGDVLFFHSFLMHKSTDNRSEGRRAALVYHYGRAATGMPEATLRSIHHVNRWIPARRAPLPGPGITPAHRAAFARDGYVTAAGLAVDALPAAAASLRGAVAVREVPDAAAELWAAFGPLGDLALIPGRHLAEGARDAWDICHPATPVSVGPRETLFRLAAARADDEPVPAEARRFART